MEDTSRKSIGCIVAQSMEILLYSVSDSGLGWRQLSVLSVDQLNIGGCNDGSFRAVCSMWIHESHDEGIVSILRSEGAGVVRFAAEHPDYALMCQCGHPAGNHIAFGVDDCELCACESFRVMTP